MTGASRLYTIPSGANFARELAAGMIARWPHARDPFAIADCLVFLPTRRAVRAVEAAFAARADAPGMLLPRLRALGDLDASAGEADDPSAVAGRELTPPPMAPLERALALMEMVMAWDGRDALAGERPPRDAALALGLAQDLAALFDAAALERMDWDKLADLVPLEIAGHWQKTLDFLKILTVEWPSWLGARGRSDPGRFRDAQLSDLANHWSANPPDHPVLIAGSTGSVKATADVMAAVLKMSKGAVILPGLDLALDTAAWDAAGPDHPQFVMKELLARLGRTRRDVEAWATARGAAARAALWSQVMRPAAASGRWASFAREAKPEAAKMVRGLSVLESANPNAEALNIALILRETLETPDATAALVTPNRNLARRVAAEMRRWGVTVDDSAGRPLSKTPIGAFMSLTMAAVAADFAPVPLLSLLKHPYCAFGATAGRTRARAMDLEMAALRGPRPGSGLAGLRRVLMDHGDLLTFIAELEAAYAPLLEPAPEGRTTPDWVARLRSVAEALTTSGDDDPWADEAGIAAVALFEELSRVGYLHQTLTLSAFARVFDVVMDGRAVRQRGAAGSRIDILGPLEARLQTADVVVLGGLNEPGWPGVAEVDGWVNRPMRRELGLSQPERRIGQSAHDFVEAACAPRVVLSRAMKEEGGPANPSRWLVRLEALLTALGVAEACREARVLDWGAATDRPQTIIPGRRPAPRPPVAARPRELYVTHVEQWVRDPYAHYVRRILRLSPLDPIGMDPSAAERGTFIHAALDRFVRACPQEIPNDAIAQLEAIGLSLADEMALPPGVMAVWWPRFVRIVKWVVEVERGRRGGLAQITTEIEGALRLHDLNFTIKAKADRIETARTGAVTVVDYKTGRPPTKDEIAAGFAPQLPLEAAMILAGAFPAVMASSMPEFQVFHLTGKDDGGKVIAFENGQDLAEKALDGLRRRIRRFDDPQTDYPSRPYVQFRRKEDDYGYIARAAESDLDAEGEA